MGGGDEKTQEVAEKEQPEEDKPVELTEEEKGMWHRKCASSDLTPSNLARSFASYSVPSKEEGFDEIKYVWQKADKCAELLREWVLDHKKTMRIEDLEPSNWFKDRWNEFQKVLNEWKRRQTEAKEAAKKLVVAQKT